MKALKWGLTVATLILVILLVNAIGLLIDNLLGEDYLVIDIIKEGVCGFVFVVVGSLMAPNYQRIVARSLAAIYGFFGLSIWIIYIAEAVEVEAFYIAIAQIVGSVVGCKFFLQWQEVHEIEKYFKKLAKSVTTAESVTINIGDKIILLGGRSEYLVVGNKNGKWSISADAARERGFFSDKRYKQMSLQEILLDPIPPIDGGRISHQTLTDLIMYHNGIAVKNIDGVLKYTHDKTKYYCWNPLDELDSPTPTYAWNRIYYKDANKNIDRAKKAVEHFILPSLFVYQKRAEKENNKEELTSIQSQIYEWQMLFTMINVFTTKPR